MVHVKQYARNEMNDGDCVLVKCDGIWKGRKVHPENTILLGFTLGKEAYRMEKSCK